MMFFIVSFFGQLILAATPASAESPLAKELGIVVSHSPPFAITDGNGDTRKCSEKPILERDEPTNPDENCPTYQVTLKVGDKLRTGPGGGAAELIFFEEQPQEVAAQVATGSLPDDFDAYKARYVLLANTNALVKEADEESGNSILVTYGSAHWMVGGTLKKVLKRAPWTLRGRNGRAYAKKTEVILHQQGGTDGVTEVVAVAGVVEVRGEKGAEQLSAGQRSFVRPDSAPTEPVSVDPLELRELLEYSRFVGLGRAQSFTNDHLLLMGMDVPAPDRAPLGPPVWPDDDRRWPDQPESANVTVTF